MKSQLFSVFTLVILFIGAASFTACEKDPDQTPDQLKMTDEEVLDLVSGALVYGAEGVSADAVEAAYIADGSVEKDLEILECGETADSLFIRNYNEPRLSATYNNYLQWGLECTDIGLPSILTFGREMDGKYETSRLMSTDAATSSWSVGNLITGANYVLNGNYLRTGTQDSKVREMRTFTSTLDITIDDLNVDKGERRITSGIASYQLSGTINGEESFSYEGDIVFLGDGSATIIINGNSYTVDLF